MKNLPVVPYLFYAFGVVLLVAGLGVWWFQNRALATLEDPAGRVGLAVVATQVLPTSTAMPPVTPEATATPTVPDAPAAPTSTPQPTLTSTPDPFPPALSPPTRLVIPKIGVDSPIVTMMWEYKEDNGSVFTEWAVPLIEAGWHINSAKPGNGNNVVVSGHNNIGGEIFRSLELLEPGDEAQLMVGDVTYRYVVEEKYILREAGMPLEVRIENNAYIQATDDERLTLVSCWPYETNSHRIVIIARPQLS